MVAHQILRPAVALITLLLVPLPVTADQASDRASVLLQQAHEHLGAGDAAQAIEKLETVDQLTDGRSLDALLLLAIAKNSFGEAEDAIDVAKRALELDPDPIQAADIHFQIGLAWLTRAAPESGGQWNSRRLRRAEEALREAIRAETPRVLEAKAHLGYVVVLRENQKTQPTRAGYDEGLALARERYEEGSPGSGMDIARFVLCGSPTCEPMALPSSVESPKLPSSADGEEKGPVTKPKRLTPAGYAPGMTFAKQHGIRGRVVVWSMITKEGRLANIRIIEGLPFGINEMVVDDLKRQRFEPATQDGKPVEVAFQTVFNYP